MMRRFRNAAVQGRSLHPAQMQTLNLANQLLSSGQPAPTARSSPG